nr:hypothetical protein [uncultured Rhodopila sp.]
MSVQHKQRLPAAASELKALASSHFAKVPKDVLDLMVEQLNVINSALRSVALRDDMAKEWEKGSAADKAWFREHIKPRAGRVSA